jgi:hypothetical protein
MVLPGQGGAVDDGRRQAVNGHVPDLGPDGPGRALVVLYLWIRLRRRIAVNLGSSGTILGKVVVAYSFVRDDPPVE